MLRAARSSPSSMTNLSWCPAIKNNAVCYLDCRCRASKNILANDSEFFLSSSRERDRNKNKAWGRGNGAGKGSRRNLSLWFQLLDWERKEMLSWSLSLAASRISEAESISQDQSPAVPGRTWGSSHSCCPFSQSWRHFHVSNSPISSSLPSIIWAIPTDCSVGVFHIFFVR